MTGVVKAEVPELPVAYCEDCDKAWHPDDCPDPEGHCHRAASQHTRDTGHTAAVAVAQLTKYTPEVKP